MRSTTLLAIAATAATAIAAGTASASLTIKGSAGGGWMAFPSSLNDYSNPNRAFWDQDTKDRAGTITNRNIGNYLNNTWTGSLPGGSAPSPAITPQWWGRASNPDFMASMDNSIGFELQAPSDRVAAQLRVEVAGHRNGNELGWYSLSDVAGSETLNAVFSGPTSPVTSTIFAPAGEFGLYIKTGGGQIFFTESARNRNANGSALPANDRATQHFAIFGSNLTLGAEEYYIGVEDLARANTGQELVGDYNDMIFRITAVPTPGSVALVGIGGLLMARRRR